MIDDVLNELRQAIEKSKDALRRETAKLRTGRAHPSMLDSIRVDYYGQTTPLGQMATVSVPEPRLLTVKPWDKSQVKAAEKALRGADVVSLTTDSLIPVIKAEWLEPGMHINNVRNNEAGPDVLARAHVRARLGTSTLFADRSTAEVVTGSDGMFGFIAGTAEEKKQIPSSPHFEIDNPDIGTVPDIMAGRWAGRTNDQQITFLNNQGTQGLQFAAVGGTAYNLAKAKGLGHPLPLEWFTQNIRD